MWFWCLLGMAVLQQQDYINSMVKALHTFQQNDYLCDTVLIARDGRLRAHSPVLAAASPFFKSSLKSHYKPVEHVVHVGDVELYLLQMVIYTIYTGDFIVTHASLSEDSTSKLTKLFTYLGMQLPMRLTERYIELCHIAATRWTTLWCNVWYSVVTTTFCINGRFWNRLTHCSYHNSVSETRHLTTMVYDWCNIGLTIRPMLNFPIIHHCWTLTRFWLFQTMYKARCLCYWLLWEW